MTAWGTTLMENKIDTQGMSGKGKMHFTAPPKPEVPFEPSVRRVFTEQEREELKEIITEALNEWWINK